MTELSRAQFLRTAALTVGAGVALPLAASEPAVAAGSGTTFTGAVNDQGGQLHNVTNPAYGAVHDTVRSNAGGSIAAGSGTFTQAAVAEGTSTGAAISFTSGDVGKVLTLQGAGAAGGVLSTLISSVVSPTTVTLAAVAATSVTDAGFAYGTDDTAALVAAITAAGDEGTVYLPAGIYTVRAASNGGRPIVHTGRGGIRGRGGKSILGADPRRGSNTVLLCADAAAGLIANGSARYESILCDGNNLATHPLQNGSVVDGAVTSTSTLATFLDVWATGSAGTGWGIYGASNNAYYDCGTTDNALDGLHVDGGSTSLLFFHFHERGDRRYGIHGDDLVASTAGAHQATTGIRFFSSRMGDEHAGPPGVSTIYLRNAADWHFPHTTVLGANLAGPTVDLDQTAGHGIDLSHCRISGSQNAAAVDPGTSTPLSTGRKKPKKGAAPPPAVPSTEGWACVRISGAPSNASEGLFLKLDGCQLLDADHSVVVGGDPGARRYSAVGGWRDTTRLGPKVAAGVPAFDTLFDGRTGPWQTATATAPWSGTVSYRVMAERWIEMKGSIVHSGVGAGPIVVLPHGYRPLGQPRRVPAAASVGLAVAIVSSAGDVTAAPVGAGPFAAGTTVHLDGVRFTIGAP